MKKLKHEAELIKAAILAGMKYGEDRGAVVSIRDLRIHVTCVY